MLQSLNAKAVTIQALIVAGIYAAPSMALAQNTNFSDIARNISSSVEEVPGFVSGLSYLVGIVMGVLGVFKLKDHVDSPDKTPLKQGVVRVLAGGALLSLPIVYDAMLTTIGTTTASVSTPMLNRVEFNVR